ncbi:MAG: DMT family transporter, partial [Geminicoccaceae bacterium]
IYFSVNPSVFKDFVHTRYMKLHILRSCLLFASLVALFSSLKFLPLPDVISIAFTAPIFVILLARPVLQESVPLHSWAAVVISLLGTLIILKPSGSAMMHWSLTLPIISAICSAGFFITTRMLANKDRDVVVLYSTSFFGLIWSTLLVPFFWNTPTGEQWLFFLTIGFLGAVAHLLIILAFANAPAPVLAPYMYVRLVWTVIFGYFAFNELISLQTAVGAAFIIASCLYLLRLER